MAKILVLHGPNLNLLGAREPDVYGSMTLAEIDKKLILASKNNTIECFQSNSESVLIERIHQAKVDEVAGIVFNPAGYAHTSIALRDALLAVELPFVEVHLSNIFAREPFRQKSYFSDIALGCITGLGVGGYVFALHFLVEYLER